MTQNPKADEPTIKEVAVAAHKRKKKRTYEELTEGLPEEEILLALKGDQIVCAKCGGTLRLIGKKFVKSEIIYIPAQVKLLKYFACTYACDQCENKTGFEVSLFVLEQICLERHFLLADPGEGQTCRKMDTGAVQPTQVQLNPDSCES